MWFAAHGIVDDRTVRGSAFSDDMLLLRAAVGGQGFALLRESNVADELRDGRLERVLAEAWPARFAYYLVHLPGAARASAVRASRAWLIEAAARWTEPRGMDKPPG